MCVAQEARSRRRCVCGTRSRSDSRLLHVLCLVTHLSAPLHQPHSHTRTHACMHLHVPLPHPPTARPFGRPGTKSGAIAALVALTCASGSYQSIANTIALLGGFAADGIIPVRRTIDRLARNNERPMPLVLSPFSQPSASWVFDGSALLDPSDHSNSIAGSAVRHPRYPNTLKYSTRTSGWNCDGGCG